MSKVVAVKIKRDLNKTCALGFIFADNAKIARGRDDTTRSLSYNDRPTWLLTRLLKSVFFVHQIHTWKCNYNYLLTQTNETANDK